ncbi:MULTISPECIES: hypothetical protein [Rhodomicrobium]|uniref:hypothetical protein n=1 Tax=Rhodomicrobium TaxID=1068 RepID=UPI000F746401|nr:MULTISPECIES: hypothetical protein [Rhodomicrobium]
MISQQLVLRALAGCLAVTAVPAAHAESSTVGIAVTLERQPDDFSDNRGTDVELNGAHVFDNGIIVGGYMKYYDTTSIDQQTLNTEGVVGYTHSFFNKRFNLSGTGGVGERVFIEGDSDDFPYYVFRLAGDIPLTDRTTWNMFTLRYRDAFDGKNDYNTPEIGTGFTYKIDEGNTVSIKLERDYSDGRPSYTGLELGYKYHF